MGERRRTRSNGEGAVWHDKARGRWVATVTVGYEDVTDAEGRPVIGKDGAPRQRQIRRSVTGRTKAAVLDRLRELSGAVESGQELARADLTVARFLDTWVTDVLPSTVSPGTEANYRNMVTLYLRPLIGQKRLRNLTVRDVRVMLQHLEHGWTAPDGTERRPVSPNTRRLARSVLRRALRWAEAEGMVTRNVAALADGVKVGTPEGRTLTPDQARQLLAFLAGPVTSPSGRTVTAEQAEAIVDANQRTTAGRHRLTAEQAAEDRLLRAFITGHRLEAAFAVALALGLRRGELLGLCWEDVDLDASPPRLTVRRSLKRIGRGLALDDTKTKQSRRTVHLPAPVVAQLRAHRRRQLEDRLAAGELWTDLPLGADLIFRTALGTAVDPDNFRNITYRVTEAAGIGRWSPHELRHSCASLLLAQGVPLKVVSEVLGHSSIRVTADVYSHLLEPAKAEAAEAATAALWGAS